MVFGLFAALPHGLSLALWLLIPLAAALAVSGGDPLVLLFAPLFGHFAGGQTAVFAMLGLWGYRKFSDPRRGWGGVFLALLLLKPQLAVIPMLFAAADWWKELRATQRVCRQALAWLGTSMVLFVPGFILYPGWVGQWLSQPRPLFGRALSGIIPRLLLGALPWHSAAYWAALAIFSLSLLGGVWLVNRKKPGFDLAVLWYFAASPLVHDYDLVQLIPLLENNSLRIAAALLSIPGWLVILFAYQSDSAWVVFTLVAPGLLVFRLIQQARSRRPSEVEPVSI
jgi:hypothetical protein